VAHFARDHGTGALLRILALEPTSAGSSLPDSLVAELDALGLTCEGVDLLLDLAWWDTSRSVSTDDTAWVLDRVVSLGNWRSLTVAGTSIPHTLGSIALDVVTAIPRRKWSLYRLVADSSCVRFGFGDYGIQGVRVPADGFGPIANVRYTTDEATWVARGTIQVTKLSRGERQDAYRRVCEMLLERQVTVGPECCWGDAMIEACARRLVPGDQTMWRGVGWSHHIRTVTLDLQERDRLAAVRLGRSPERAR